MTISKDIISTNRSSRFGVDPAPPLYRRVPAYLIRRLQMISTAILVEEFEGEDMPASEWAVLTMVDNHPEIDQSRLAEVVAIDKTNTGRLVDQLEARAWLNGGPTSRTGGCGCFA